MTNSKKTKKGKRLGIVTDFYFAQIPDRLIRDPSIPVGARLLYGIYHSHCDKKDLRKEIPETNPYQIVIALELGCSITTIWRYDGILELEGWIKVENRGWQANLITLYSKPRR